jgi:hypothetical protein
LIDWLYSTISQASYAKDEIDKLCPYFEAIRAENGFIEMEKETGLFVCVKSEG